MLTSLSNNNLLIQLAITLLHFLWQGLVVAALLAIFLKFIPKHKTVLRYSASLVALASCLLLMIATFFSVSEVATGIGETQRQVLVLSDESQAKAIGDNGFIDGFYQLLPYLSLIYLVGLLFFTLKLGYELKRVTGFRDQGVKPAEQALQLKMAQLAAQLKLTKVPRLLISLKAKTPMAIGIFKPVVLLPFSMVSNLTTQQIEMLLLHELAHIRRYDYAVNLLQSIAELILFYHPAVRWISTQVRNEREYCSDQVALHHCQNPLAYAHTLADTAELCRHHIPQMAVAASGGDLKGRIERIVAHRCSGQSRFAQLQLASFLPVIIASWVIVGSLSQLSPTTIKTSTFKPVELPTQPPKASALTSALYQEDAIPPSMIASQESLVPQVSPSYVVSENADSQLLLAANQSPAKASFKKAPVLEAEILPKQAVTPVQSEPSQAIVEQKPKATPQTVKKVPLVSKEARHEPNKVPVQLTAVSEPLSQKAPVVDVFVQPEVLRTTQPAYPRLAKRKRIESSIKVSYTIDENGRVTDLSFEDAVGQRTFRNSVKDALLKWRYKPAKLNGQPIATQMTKIFEFSLT